MFKPSFYTIRDTALITVLIIYIAQGHIAKLPAYPKTVITAKRNKSFFDFDHVQRGAISFLCANIPNATPTPAIIAASTRT